MIRHIISEGLPSVVIDPKAEEALSREFKVQGTSELSPRTLKAVDAKNITL